MAEVWAAVGEPGSGFVTGLDELPWSTPGLAAAAAREEARARAEARREAEELAEKVEARRNAAVMMSHRWAAAHGQPWSPADPWATWPSQDAFTEMIFAEQDRQARRDDFAAAKQAGLIHVLNVSPQDMVAGEVVLQDREQVEDRAVRTELLHARRRSFVESVRAKARRALAHTGRPRA